MAHFHLIREYPLMTKGWCESDCGHAALTIELIRKEGADMSLSGFARITTESEGTIAEYQDTFDDAREALVLLRSALLCEQELFFLVASIYQDHLREGIIAPSVQEVSQ